MSKRINEGENELKLPKANKGENVRCVVVVKGQKRNAWYNYAFGWLTINFCPLEDVESWEYDI